MLRLTSTRSVSRPLIDLCRVPSTHRANHSHSSTHEHLDQDVSDDDSALPNVRLTTRDCAHAHEIVEELGVVVGTSARSRSIFHDIWGRLKGVWGGELLMYRDLFQATTAEATKNAMEDAHRLGATDIVRVRYEVSSNEEKIIGVSCFVLCVGTAVRTTPKK